MDRRNEEQCDWTMGALRWDTVRPGISAHMGLQVAAGHFQATQRYNVLIICQSKFLFMKNFLLTTNLEAHSHF